MKSSTVLAIVALAASSSVVILAQPVNTTTTTSTVACNVCAGNQDYQSNPILSLSTGGIDRVSCSNLMGLIDSGLLPTEICDTEKEVIAEACCSDKPECVCYAHDGQECPSSRAPVRLRDNLSNLYRTNDRHVCSAVYDGCRYSANNIVCDDHTYNVDAVIYCDSGCTPLPVDPKPQDETAGAPQVEEGDLEEDSFETENSGAASSHLWMTGFVILLGTMTGN